MQRTPDQKEAAGDWINLHNEQLHGSYCLLNIIRVAAVVHVTSMEWKRREMHAFGGEGRT